MAAGGGSDQERTEQPTAKRREEARRRGQVARSHDLGAAAVLLAAIAAWMMSADRFFDDARVMLERAIVAMPTRTLTIDTTTALLRAAAHDAVALAGPIVLAPVVVAVAVHLVQTRAVLAPEALKPQWSRLDPMSGLGRILGIHGAVELAKAVLKLTLVAGVALLTLRADWTRLLGDTRPGEVPVPLFARAVSTVWLRVGLAYLALALADYGYQWWRHEKSLRMTREEARQEMKETEGNPTLRARLRSVHRQMARRRMMAAVRTADVVVRNPTHVAVALKYERGTMRAPRVVAKGQRLLALRIIEIAKKYGVPVMENRPLARALHDGVKVGAEIPYELYRAVAEVLAYVYSLRRYA